MATESLTTFLSRMQRGTVDGYDLEELTDYLYFRGSRDQVELFEVTRGGGFTYTLVDHHSWRHTPNAEDDGYDVDEGPFGRVYLSGPYCPV